MTEPQSESVLRPLIMIALHLAALAALVVLIPALFSR